MVRTEVVSSILTGGSHNPRSLSGGSPFGPGDGTEDGARAWRARPASARARSVLVSGQYPIDQWVPSEKVQISTVVPLFMWNAPQLPPARPQMAWKSVGGIAAASVGVAAELTPIEATMARAARAMAPRRRIAGRRMAGRRIDERRRGGRSARPAWVSVSVSVVVRLVVVVMGSSLVGAGPGGSAVTDTLSAIDRRTLDADWRRAGETLGPVTRGAGTGQAPSRASWRQCFSSKTKPSKPSSAISSRRSKYCEPRRWARNWRGFPGMLAPVYHDFVRG